ncbi:uncharacterized protein LOC144452041 isoform X2 [Glandiceps talaboti]
MNIWTTYLNVEDNAIGPEGTRHIVEMLQENVAIQRLNLSENGLGSEGARLICEYVEAGSRLTNLHLRGNGFKDSDAAFFAKLLKSRTTGNLKEINLSYNEFSEKGGVLLASAIESNDTLLKLDLSWNHLRRKGALSICKALKVNSCLTYVDLSWNGLADEGAVIIAVVIRKNEILTYLDIGFNRISKIGIGKITNALKYNQTLRILKLSGNTITLSGAVAMLVALETNADSALDLLDLGNESVSREFVDHLEDLQLERPKLKVIHGPMVRDINANLTNTVPFLNPAKALTDYIVKNQLRAGDLFHRFDKNRDNKISKSDLRHGLREIDLPMSAAERKVLYNDLDRHDKGYIDYSDFVGTIQQLVSEERRRRVKLAIRTTLIASRFTTMMNRKRAEHNSEDRGTKNIEEGPANTNDV